MILIIDDRPEEKIGNFKNLLDKYGIEYKIVTNNIGKNMVLKKIILMQLYWIIFFLIVMRI